MVDEYVETGDVRFVYRHLPVVGRGSFRAAEAAECGAEQGRFWEYHDAVFLNKDDVIVGELSDPDLMQFADQSGLDLDIFKTCLEADRYADAVREDARQAAYLGVRFTPTVFINGRRLDGLQGYDVYRKVIEEELENRR